MKEVQHDTNQRAAEVLHEVKMLTHTVASTAQATSHASVPSSVDPSAVDSAATEAQEKPMDLCVCGELSGPQHTEQECTSPYHPARLVWHMYTSSYEFLNCVLFVL